MRAPRLIRGDCIKKLRLIRACSVASCITDPPYELGFMGKRWDNGGISFKTSTWQAVLRVLKPGGFMLCFGGTRTHHRLMCAIEDAGFEIRDCIMWVYGSGFPKSLDVSKAIDKAAGHWRGRAGKFKKGDTKRAFGQHYQRNIVGPPITDAAKPWNGWGTALKPAWEPIIVAMKPLSGTFANNALTHGVGGLNVDGCRVAHQEPCRMMAPSLANIERPSEKCRQAGRRTAVLELKPEGRFPANLIHDGSDEVLGLFPERNGRVGMTKHGSGTNSVYGKYERTSQSLVTDGVGDSGSAARFFYCAKASKSERNAGLNGLPFGPPPSSARSNPAPGRKLGLGEARQNHHPTVKPLALMEYLCTLTRTPTGGVVLDPFMGSGTTGIACVNTGRSFTGIEQNPEYFRIARRRITYATRARVSG